MEVVQLASSEEEWVRASLVACGYRYMMHHGWASPTWVVVLIVDTTLPVDSVLDHRDFTF